MSEEKSFPKTSINWFPGHMVKAINEIKANIKLIDIVCVVLDSRIPDSSKNDIIFDIAKDKPIIIIFNKADLADEEALKVKINEYEKKGYYTVHTNASVGQGMDKLIQTIIKVGKEVKYASKSSKAYDDINPIYRVLISGIPNVGKSTIINKLAGKRTANVGNKPGVTRKKQWIRLENNIQLMDTPGILWHKLDENDAGTKLALTGNIKEEILLIDELALELIKYLKNNDKYFEMLCSRYKLSKELKELENYEILEEIGKNRGAIIKGGEVDYNKIAKILIDEFNAGLIGKISLE